ncbi:MAG TPA: arsenite methyltransferase, partial [Thermomicrobiales bacterium]|nr:arsenite methyltransferase [Thermomicrobiales bacterium]
MTQQQEPAASAIRDVVRERYASAVTAVLNRESASCCGGSAAEASCCGSGSVVSPIVIGNYTPGETSSLPEEAVLASFGCGNPVALAKLEPGQTVLDLGSGGGIDVLLSAKRVGPTGFVYGLDMTDEMLELAERNKQAAGIDNVRFLKGEIEAIPLPEAAVDVIISNCVINLAADKDVVLADAFRVLRPGGWFAVSDVVVQGDLTDELRSSMDAWAGCVAGALEEHDYLRRLTAAGFVDASIEVTSTYDLADIGCCADAANTTNGSVVSAFIRARKPE